MQHKKSRWFCYIFVSLFLFPILLHGKTKVVGTGKEVSARSLEHRSQVKKSGRLNVVQEEDYEHGNAKLHYFLDETEGPQKGSALTGKRYELRLDKKLKNLKSGDEISLIGTEEGPRFSSKADSVSVTSVSPGPLSGSRSVVVLLVNFQDKAVGLVPSTIYQNVFTSAKSPNANISESSFGNLNLTGDVFGPINIAANTTDACTYTSWASMADNAAAAAGIAMSNYQHRVYAFPKYAGPSTGCSTGLGDVGCGSGTCRVYLFGSPYNSDSGTYTHELGHNLGYHHAATQGDEYGDISSPMGNHWLGLAQFHGINKVHNGWLPSPPTVKSGNYVINATEFSSGNLIRIAKPNTADAYYLSYRQPSGLDSTLNSKYLDGVNIHTWAGGTSKTYFISRLTDGGVFTDSANGISITQTSHDSSSVSVSLTNVCTKNAPVVSVSPSSQYAQSGATKNYLVTIANTDSSGCNDTSFNLQASVPQGFSTAFSPGSVTISAGANATTTLSVTSSSGASGTANIIITAADPTQSNHLASTTASYIIDTTAPTIPLGLTAKQSGKGKKRSVSLAWAPSTDSLGYVGGYEIYRDGVKIIQVTSTSYADKSPLVVGRVYRYTVRAFDASNNFSGMSAPAEITLR